MKTWRQAARDGMISGSIAGAVSGIVISLCGKAEGDDPVAPVNAVSHWVWGDRAARHGRPTWRHTALGYLIHHLATVFWAMFYEKWFGGRAEKQGPAAALAGGAAVATLAYIGDYWVAPKRLTPGFEMRLSSRARFVVYASLAASFGLRALLAARRQVARPAARNPCRESREPLPRSRCPPSRRI